MATHFLPALPRVPRSRDFGEDPSDPTTSLHLPHLSPARHHHQLPPSHRPLIGGSEALPSVRRVQGLTFARRIGDSIQPVTGAQHAHITNKKSHPPHIPKPRQPTTLPPINPLRPSTESPSQTYASVRGNRSGKELWGHALERVVASVKAIRAFTGLGMGRDTEAGVREAEQPSLIATRLNFNMDDYRTSGKRFVGRLSSSMREILLKSPHQLDDGEIDRLYKLTSIMGAFTRYDPEIRRSLAGVVRYEVYGPGRVIVKQGHEAQNFYFILSGEVEIKKQVDDGRTISLSVLKSGDSFGELALLQNVKRTATVVTQTETEVLRLGKQDFVQVLKAEAERDLQAKMQLLGSLQLFSHLPSSVLRFLAETAQTRDIMPDEVLVAEGGVPSFVYIIRVLKAVNFLRTKGPDSKYRLIPYSTAKSGECTAKFARAPTQGRGVKRPPSQRRIKTRTGATKVTDRISSRPHTRSTPATTRATPRSPTQQLVTRLLRATDAGPGSYFGEASAIASLGSQSLFRDLAASSRTSDAYHLAQASVVANTRVRCLLISRADFVRVCTSEMAVLTGRRLREDERSLLCPEKLQEAYLTRKRYAIFAKSVINEVIERREQIRGEKVKMSAYQNIDRV
ncbi:hypothetical protein HK104_000760 [Borealophlyctis nickersoniae]|nr:hypothetical protein HK104_000760 [Borealophlyctis nickersoniae]